MTGWRKRQIENLIAGAEQQGDDDKEYELVEEHDAKRLVFVALRELSLEVARLKERIEKLEQLNFGDGK